MLPADIIIPLDGSVRLHEVDVPERHQFKPAESTRTRLFPWTVSVKVDVA